MAADKSLIQGAAALAQADSAMGSALTKGAAAGSAPVIKQFMQNIEKENKLNDQLLANAEAINMKIMTDPKAGGEYHDDLKLAAQNTRSEILTIAKNKDLSRTERNRLITEKVDGFNSVTSKYLIGQKIEQDFTDNIALGGFSNENTALKEDAATISEYFKGEGELDRTATGFVFKNWNGTKENKEISFEELKNFLPKKIDQNALTKMEGDVERLAKKKYNTDEEFNGAIKIEMNGYSIDERKNLLSNKLQYGDVSGLSEEQINTKFEQLYTENVKGMVQPEKPDALGVSQLNRADDIAGVTRTLNEINKIKPTYFGNKLRINNLPTGFRLEYVDYEDGTSKPIIARGTQKFQIDGKPNAEQLREILRGFYVDKIERYNIDIPQYTPPKPPIIN